MDATEKVVLIFTEDDEFSTDEVISWLKYFRQPFVRINNSELDHSRIKNIRFDSNGKVNFNLEVLKTKYKINLNSENIKSIWYRRGKIWNTKLNNTDSNYLTNKFVEYLQTEENVASSFLYTYFKNFNHIKYPSH